MLAYLFNVRFFKVLFEYFVNFPSARPPLPLPFLQEKEKTPLVSISAPPLFQIKKRVCFFMKFVMHALWQILYKISNDLKQILRRALARFDGDRVWKTSYENTQILSDFFHVVNIREKYNQIHKADNNTIIVTSKTFQLSFFVVLKQLETKKTVFRQPISG